VRRCPGAERGTLMSGRSEARAPGRKVPGSGVAAARTIAARNAPRSSHHTRVVGAGPSWTSTLVPNAPRARLGEDADVAFLLTTNRADLLEPALAQRPGRVDHAAEIPLPDADARRRLMLLYQRDLVFDLASPAAVIARTEGVTASFLTELLRRAAMYAADDAAGPGPGGPADRADATARPLTVRDAHMNAALDELLDSRNRLTRALLGGHAAQGPAATPTWSRRSPEDLAGRNCRRPNSITRCIPKEQAVVAAGSAGVLAWDERLASRRLGG
jgi:hypothetical protein